MLFYTNIYCVLAQYKLIIGCNMVNTKLLIGFIGQGYVGKNYADDFEDRGYNVVRYSKEKPYNLNKDKIRECDIVFIAVPTPTVHGVYDASIICKVIPLVGKNKIIIGRWTDSFCESCRTSSAQATGLLSRTDC